MRGRRKRIAKTLGCSRQTVSDVLVASGFAENSHLTEIGKLLFRATQHQGGACFSCAVFDAEGGLVANAPHIPMHLGAMS
jgi:hypothetical protein